MIYLNMKSTEEYIGLIKREFPGFGYREVRDIRIGWDHVILIFDGERVFRFPKTAEYRERLSREAAFTAFLKTRTEISLPEYEFVAAGGSFGIYRMLPGEELTLSVYTALPAKKKERIEEQISGFIKMLHGTPPADTGLAFPSENLREQAETLSADTEKFLEPVLSKEEYATAKKLIRAFLEMRVRTEDKALVHNDLGPEHILYDGNDRISVIDFSDAAIGDISIDFTGIRLYGRPFFDRVCSLYGAGNRDDIFRRTEIFLGRAMVSLMIDSFKGFPVNFSESYADFRNFIDKFGDFSIL